MRSWFTAKVVRGVGEIAIFDEIGSFGVSAADFRDELLALGNVGRIVVRINSPGGDVFDGLAIYNLLKGVSAEVEVIIDGIAASMASVIAMAGDIVRMPENAFMMLHLPSGGVLGNADDMREQADALDKIRDGMVMAYVAKTGMSTDEMVALLEAGETWLTAAEAVDMGFADEVIDAVKVAAKFGASKFKNPPAGVVGRSRGSPAPTMESEEMTTKNPGAAQETPEQMEARVRADERAKVVAEQAAAKKAEDEAAEAARKAAEGKDGKKAETAAEVEARVRASVRETAKEITAACKLAGYESMAAGFIAEGKTVAEVITALQAKKVEDEGKDPSTRRAGGDELNNHRGNGNGKDSGGIDTQAVYAKWNGVAKKK